MNTEIYNHIFQGESYSRGQRTSLYMLPLRDFLYMYGEELFNYYGEDFYVRSDEESWLNDGKIDADTMILCMVDLGDDNSFITKKGVRRSLRRAGSERRRKIKHRYSYENPMNRIHGFVILTKEYIQKYPEKKVMSISTIATSIFSENRGIGSDMMDIVIHLGEVCGYDDIILEAANDYAARAFEEEEEEEEEEEFWYPTEEVIDIISHELWRKTMRKPDGDIPYYNICKDYIWMNVNNYLLHEITPIDDVINPEYKLSKEPEDYEYGGYWYKEGKKSQKRLIEFYEKFGFVEDPNIFLNWGCYDENPYPTLRYSIVS